MDYEEEDVGFLGGATLYQWCIWYMARKWRENIVVLLKADTKKCINDKTS